MGSYENFARVYDELMDNVPYKEWSEFILSILNKNKIKQGLVLELGCGTGKLMSLLGNAGFDMIGVDNSVDMLQIAREKTSPEFLYLLQDMREFELYGTVRAVISVCDSVNYITEPEELQEVFRLVNNYLDPKGMFIFDLNTEAKFQAMGSETIAEVRDEGSFIWENEYDEEEKKIIFTHNPFSMPQGGLEALTTKDPLDLLAYQYDIVCNGVELSSGAVRNHRIDIMVKAFEIAGYTEEDLKEKFGALYNAFQYGAPPHAGMAPGVDRMIMLLRNEENIREVIPFPMNGNAQDVMCGAPNEVSEMQLREVHIKVRK